MSFSHETVDWQPPPLPGLRTQPSEMLELATMVQVTHTVMGAQDDISEAVDFAVYQAEARWIWAEMYAMAGNTERARALREQAEWILSHFQKADEADEAICLDAVTEPEPEWGRASSAALLL